MFKVGDKVRVKPEYRRDEDPTDCIFVPPMRMFLNQVVTIESAARYNGFMRYKIVEDGENWSYSDDMFVGTVSLLGENEELKKRIARLEAENKLLRGHLQNNPIQGLGRKVVNLSQVTN